MSNSIKTGRFSARVQSAISAFCAAVGDANTALDKAANTASNNIYRSALDMAKTMKAENIVLSAEEAESFRVNLLVKAGQGRASMIVGPVMANLLRVLCSPIADYQKALAVSSNDLRKLAAACPKRGNGRPKAEKPEKPETPAPATPAPATPAPATPATPAAPAAPAATPVVLQAVATIRQRLAVVETLADKSKGQAWVAARAAVHAALEALEVIESEIE